MSTLVDGIMVALLALGAWRGSRRGLPVEAYRLARIVIAFVAGCGLHGLISGALRGALSMAGTVAGPLAFLVTVGGAWYLTRWLRRGLTAWLTARYASFHRTGGAVAGALRVLLLLVALAGTLRLAGRDLDGSAGARPSFIGLLAGWTVTGR